MERQLEQLTMMTPIWTGGVETGKMDRIRETGLIGSMRWWYELIVRGLGGEVCDPTSDNPEDHCQFDTKTYERTKSIDDGLTTVCPVCRLFGCTGWKRRFELQSSATLTEPFWLATKDQYGKFNHRWFSEIYETVDNHLAFGNLELCFRWMLGYESQHKNVKALLSLMAHLGAIGPKPQYGFGVFSCQNSFSMTESLSIIQHEIAGSWPKKSLAGVYPSLHGYWLLQCTVPGSDVNREFSSVTGFGNVQTFNKYKSRLLPVSFDIRYKFPGLQQKGLRQSYRLKHDIMPARKIFGTTKGDKFASSVFVSHLYKTNETEAEYQLRVWGFTDSGLADEIEKSLKTIFPALVVNKKLKGPKLLSDNEVSA
jgi:CRISPR-associated protein Cmr1